MTEKKYFNTSSFREFANAIYRMHENLKRVKEIFKSTQDPQEAKTKIIRLYGEKMECALEDAKKHGDRWLSEMREDTTAS